MSFPLSTWALEQASGKLVCVSFGSPVWTRLPEFADPPNHQKEVLIETVQVGTPGEHDHLLAEVVELESQITDEGSG